ncbi:Hypothetical protein LUCI_1948 [Lucifera butyrica]|uniref:Uncharacterized protein n=1 Tax=Lucifera butyrica TaxID=1351585 RepID=A0A498R8W1_9FIRM|nr:hypothetical protein [Lucifera butyrica]VBB06712.1 Hypothetical protein LUCI_1948 [Lucifera butyrica]
MDDTLNNFTETLRNTNFVYSDSYGLTPEKFNQYLAMVRQAVTDESELICNDYSYFRYQIHQQCHELAKARIDGIQFMQWLKANHWRIVICTARDLRRAVEYSKLWLSDNEIPYDYCFTAQNKIVFCKMWNIKYLIDDDNLNILHGKDYGINVFYPIMEKHAKVEKGTARGFNRFEEVKQWIQE